LKKLDTLIILSKETRDDAQLDRYVRLQEEEYYLKLKLKLKLKSPGIWMAQLDLAAETTLSLVKFDRLNFYKVTHGMEYYFRARLAARQAGNNNNYYTVRTPLEVQLQLEVELKGS
jgi:hypothetical protein